MTIHVHQLTGCAPAPLADYLKALAVLRLVAEQVDPNARALWRGDTFVLATRFDRHDLVDFFLRAYQPTPLVAPWNGGSGFYPKDTKEGINAIATSAHQRFADYRRTIELCRDLVRDCDQAPKEDDKLALVRECRARFRGSCAAWLNAALVITERLSFPALLGTGGNDGRLDFTNNQMQRLVELISPVTGEPRADAAPLLEAALWHVPTAGLQSKAIGQFLPGAAGGANSTAGYSGDSLINPWDFVLMLEGAVLLQVAAVRRLDAAGLPQASAPFAVRPQAGGYASASAADESARGEQWMPLWDAPATLAEVRALFAEGRLQTGRRRARRALDAARAVVRLGTARGVREFVRYGFIERNGQANLAVPLGRWRVAPQPHIHLLDEVDPWVQNLRRRSTSRGAPASLGRDARHLEHIMLALCREGERPERWIELLCALGRAEDQLVRRGKSTAELQLAPLPPLSPEWLGAANDRSPEFHLAAALASQYSEHPKLGSIRSHCLPLDPQRPTRFETTKEGLARHPSVVWTGTNLVADLGAIAWRRLLDCRTAGAQGFELRGRLYARLGDINEFLAGHLDHGRLAALARALMAMRWDSPVPRDVTARHDLDRDAWTPSPAHALFRLSYMPAPQHAPNEQPSPLDPAPLRLLLAGRLHDAARHAVRRVPVILDARPKFHQLVGPADLAYRLAASLCFPVDPRPDLVRSDIGRLRRALLKRPEITQDPPTEALQP